MVGQSIGGILLAYLIIIPLKNWDITFLLEYLVDFTWVDNYSQSGLRFYLFLINALHNCFLYSTESVLSWWSDFRLFFEMIELFCLLRWLSKTPMKTADFYFISWFHLSHIFSPVILVATVIFVIQLVLVRIFFVQERGQFPELALDNRWNYYLTQSHNYWN